MESFHSYLKQFPNYSQASIDAVRPFLSTNKIEAGEYYLREGKICKSIAFIEAGLVRLFYLSDGKEITHCFCRENSITTSYTSLITQTASEIAIQAIEDTTLIVLPYFSMQKLYNDDPFWQQVGRISAENEYVRTESLNRLVSDQSATDRYLQILAHDPELVQRVPLNYLASYLQIAPETLSRIRKKVSRT